MLYKNQAQILKFTLFKHSTIITQKNTFINYEKLIQWGFFLHFQDLHIFFEIPFHMVHLVQGASFIIHQVFLKNTNFRNFGGAPNNRIMGSEQSTKSTETRVMETANFDFRDKPRRKRRSKETTYIQYNHMSSIKSKNFWEPFTYI